MSTVQRELPVSVTGSSKGAAVALGELMREIASKSSAIGATFTGVMSIPNPPPGSVDVVWSFVGEVDEQALDAALAAYPSAAQPVAGPVAGQANAANTIAELPLGPGEHVALEVVLHLLTGTYAAAKSGVVKATLAVHRRPSGEVIVPRPVQAITGTTPVEVSAVATALGVHITYSVRATEQFEVLFADVIILNSAVRA